MKQFKNDKERIAFLEDYRNEENGWYLWKHDEDLGQRWWRHNLPDSTALIAEEKIITVMWPKKSRRWIVTNWYIISGSYRSGASTFGDCLASRTQALQKIKEIQKAERGEQ